MREAINAHDAEALVASFAPDCRSEQPTHPHREYVGRDTLVAIWGELFRAVPDLTGEVVADGPNVWVEWHWRGHHTDGSLIEMRGTAITELTDDGLVASQRLCGEPVEHAGPAIEEAPAPGTGAVIAVPDRG